MNYELLIKETETFITKYMRKHDNPGLLFHNLPQTEYVLSVINQLAKDCALKEEDVFIVKAAGWFLYVGYYKDARHPDVGSAKLAEEFFRDAGVEAETIELIKKCILSATNAAIPDTLLGEIMHDANSAYIGTDNFFRDNKLKRKEFEMLYGGRRINKNEWNSKTIQMLESHEFYTDYMSRLNIKKRKILKS
jgi:predicted metal-dependent HD superfamily phosphohydrolase